MESGSGVEECAWGLLTLGSPGTGAFVGIDQVNAGAPILAWLGETFIDLVRAVGPHISWHALRDKEEGRGKRRSPEEKESRERKKEPKVNQCLTLNKGGFCLPGAFLTSILPRPVEPLFQLRFTSPFLLCNLHFKKP